MSHVAQLRIEYLINGDDEVSPLNDLMIGFEHDMSSVQVLSQGMTTYIDLESDQKSICIEKRFKDIYSRIMTSEQSQRRGPHEYDPSNHIGPLEPDRRTIPCDVEDDGFETIVPDVSDIEGGPV